MFALIAHDLRSPLTAVMGYASMIKNLSNKDMDPDKIREYAQNVATGTSSLTELVENLLQWAQLQMDDITFAPQKVSLKEVATSALDPLTTVARGKDVSFLLDLPDINILADTDMLQTILRNLINNGIKFTNPGGTISISCGAQTTTSVDVLVTDDGVGMSAEIVDKLEAGSSLESTTGTSNEPGTGLGLKICHKMIRAHDSALFVESEVGKGSTFRFSLPVV
jgi:two-component system, sensor histidine kinase and response regulator